MEPIPIRKGSTGVELAVPMFTKDVTIDLDGTVVETVTRMDVTGYGVEFTFKKFDTEGALVATICKDGLVVGLPVTFQNTNEVMQVPTYLAGADIFDTVGKLVVTVTITQGAIVRTPNEELIFKIIPNEHC